ncbi:hypothetical protein GCM10022419_133780 [Nonomuraea rosea]|uniref:Uncharacterized protein n=1 Tax=Nonomuraea rosea TaxID=638574 RepID=A0ABP7A5T8_9ACTN
MLGERQSTKQLTDVQHELERMSAAEQVVTQILATAERGIGDLPTSGTSTSAGFLIIPYRQQASGLGELPTDYQLLLQTVMTAEAQKNRPARARR